ncbi:hypothetical protein L3X38_037201 [Prunus dulcis]|uniref:Uncharacterized protein n=1 Tax=Prunus dulcis TaxID=3755 RepID=A0AAD4V460_PRUDU|nr:hypothetical protein L3X38_037201 [Prunus dulcis]
MHSSVKWSLEDTTLTERMKLSLRWGQSWDWPSIYAVEVCLDPVAIELADRCNVCYARDVERWKHHGPDSDDQLDERYESSNNMSGKRKHVPEGSKDEIHRLLEWLASTLGYEIVTSIAADKLQIFQWDYVKVGSHMLGVLINDAHLDAYGWNNDVVDHDLVVDFCLIIALRISRSS